MIILLNAEIEGNFLSYKLYLIISTYVFVISSKTVSI